MGERSRICETTTSVASHNESEKMREPNTPAGALSRHKAADYLDISLRLLDELLSASLIPRLKIGRKTVVRVSDLDFYLAKLAARVEPATQKIFEFAIMYQTTVWSDRNDVKIAKGQVALLAALVAAKDHQASLDDATANLSDKFEDDGKWRGQITKGLQKDGLIEKDEAKNSRRVSRNGGLLWSWRLVDSGKAKLKIESLQRWIDGIEKPAKGLKMAELFLSGITADDLQAKVAAEVVELLLPILTAANEPRLVDGDRMAELADVSRPTIDRGVRNGTIPSLMFGRCRRFEPRAVFDALATAVEVEQ